MKKILILSCFDSHRDLAEEFLRESQFETVSGYWDDYVTEKEGYHSVDHYRFNGECPSHIVIPFCAFRDDSLWNNPVIRTTIPALKVLPASFALSTSFLCVPDELAQHDLNSEDFKKFLKNGGYNRLSSLVHYCKVESTSEDLAARELMDWIGNTEGITYSPEKSLGEHVQAYCPNRAAVWNTVGILACAWTAFNYLHTFTSQQSPADYFLTFTYSIGLLFIMGKCYQKMLEWGNRFSFFPAIVGNVFQDLSNKSHNLDETHKLANDFLKELSRLTQCLSEQAEVTGGSTSSLLRTSERNITAISSESVAAIKALRYTAEGTMRTGTRLFSRLACEAEEIERQCSRLVGDSRIGINQVVKDIHALCSSFSEAAKSGAFKPEAHVRVKASIF